MADNIYIIAEIGFNHDGSTETALEMIRAAAQAGANAVKFQTFRAEDIALPGSAHFGLIRSAELHKEQHQLLFDAALRLEVDFLSTPFSVEAAALLESLGVTAFKVASMDCTNKHLLGALASTGKPLFISTGMATLEEIADTLAFLQQQRSGQVTILHCLSLYPPRAEDLNLDSLELLRNLFGVRIGYSDHFPGTAACLAAGMLGAEVIETHFTLDSRRKDGDHFHSVDPQGLRALRNDLALFAQMRGSRTALLNRADRRFSVQYRRGVYAARDLKQGQELNETDLLLCRPESALTPSDLPHIIGRRLLCDVPSGMAIEERFFSGSGKQAADGPASA